MKKSRKVLSFVLALMMLVSCISVGSIKVSAESQRDAIVRIALAEEGVSGCPNKYTYAYGQIGGTYNWGWCAAFIYWCAQQAGISHSIIGRTASANVNSFNTPYYSYSSGSNVQKGDILYLLNNYGRHVGLVYAVDGTYIYTIEGNMGNAVKKYKYRRSDGYITWSNSSEWQRITHYGVPNYETGIQEPTSIIYPTSGATYKIASGVGNNMYLVFALSNNNVQIFEDGDSNSDPAWVKSQYFTLNHVGDGWYTITNVGNGSLVDVALADPSSGTNIQQCVANGSNAQLYRFYDAGDGYCYIKSKLGTYVDVQNADNFNRANVWAYSFNGTNAQKWKLIKKDVPSLTVNFVHNSSSDCADKNVIHGDAYGNLPEPKRPGFVFEGWYTALNGGTKITSSTKVTAMSNHTLYAHWKTQTVYFDVNHSNINVNLFRTINGKIIDGITFNTNSQILSLDGSFGSWTTILDIPFSVNENDWCCITANSLSGKVQDGDCVVFEAADKDLSSMTYSIGRRIHYDVAHAGNGIYNGAWGIDKSACGIKYIKLLLWSGDGPFYCEDLKLQIKIEKESRTEYSPAAQVITNGNTYGTLPTPTRDGYTFDGWYTSATGGTKITSSSKVTVTGDQTLYAHWTCKHSSTELRNVATATCTSVGYSGDTFCKNCGNKIKNGTEIEKAPHTDTNNDKICDVCSEVLGSITPDTPEEPAIDCSCNCHKGGIAGFFFKLINFFEKIFGINKVCACGVKH